MSGSMIKMNGNLFMREGYIKQFFIDLDCDNKSTEEFTNYILNIHSAIALDNVHYTFEYDFYNNESHLFLLSVAVE